jgi:hypothetical protein
MLPRCVWARAVAMEYVVANCRVIQVACGRGLRSGMLAVAGGVRRCLVLAPHVWQC